MKRLIFGLVIVVSFCNASAATINVSKSIDASTFFGIQALSNSFEIDVGDVINYSLSFNNNEALKLTAQNGSSYLGPWFASDTSIGPYTLQNITVSFTDFQTNGTGIGAFNLGTQSASGSHLGPTYIDAGDIGLDAFEYFIFSGFDISYTISALLFAESTMINLWNVDSSQWDTEEVAVPAVPVPAAVWLFGTALIGLAGLGKRKKAA
jgi:hypothetical protein